MDHLFPSVDTEILAQKNSISDLHFLCCQCRQIKLKTEFSKNQRKRPVKERRCQACVSFSTSSNFLPASSATPNPVIKSKKRKAENLEPQPKRRKIGNKQKSIIDPWRNALHAEGSVFFLGSGNFSGPAALCKLRQSLGLSCIVVHATDKMQCGSPDKRHKSIKTILSLNGVVSFGVDVAHAENLIRNPITALIFTCPHTGDNQHMVKNQEEIDYCIRKNQNLLKQTMVLAGKVLDRRRGVLIVSLKNQEPYNSWDLLGIAKDAGLELKQKGTLQVLRIFGYAHTATKAKGSVNVDSVITYVFNFPEYDSESQELEFLSPWEIPPSIDDLSDFNSLLQITNATLSVDFRQEDEHFICNAYLSIKLDSTSEKQGDSEESVRAETKDTTKKGAKQKAISLLLPSLRQILMGASFVENNINECKIDKVKDEASPSREDLSVKLERLGKLKLQGLLTDDEFAKAKSKIISETEI